MIIKARRRVGYSASTVPGGDTTQVPYLGDLDVDSALNVGGVRRVDDPWLRRVVGTLRESAVDAYEACDDRLSPWRRSIDRLEH